MEEAFGTTFSLHKPVDPDTTYRSTFNEKSIEESAIKNMNKYAKFKEYKDSGNFMARGLDPSYLPKGKSKFVANTEMLHSTVEDYGPRDVETKTFYKSLHSPNAPPAVGRSGKREERGLGGSGLSGEAFRTASNPACNSFAQRSWLYADDPSLTYRRDGVPPPPESGFENSLRLSDTGSRTANKTSFGIKSVLSADGVLKHKYGIVD